jgi:hypothetical protein
LSFGVNNPFLTESGGIISKCLSSSSKSRFFSITFFFFLSESSYSFGFFRSSKAFLKLTLAAILMIVRIYPIKISATII